MNVLLIGSGGREHGLAWKLAQSPRPRRNSTPRRAIRGSREEAELVALDVTDHAAVVDFCRAHAIDLVVVGPEAPLVAGIADDLRAAGFAVFGPSKAAAQLEGSKAFTKDRVRPREHPDRRAIARCIRSTRRAAALDEFGAPVVVKADGLAAGKGVTVAMTMRRGGEAAVETLFAERRRERGDRGIPRGRGSQPVRADRRHRRCVPFGSAQDHKRVGDGDTGPNTGGMGAYSPARVLTPELERARARRDRRADHRDAGGGGHALFGRALRRADADRRRSQADRIQCPLRRSRMPGADDAAGERPAAADAGGGAKAGSPMRPRRCSATMSR